MSGKNVAKEMKFEVPPEKTKENQKFLRVFSSSKTKDERPRFLDEETTLYCCLDNHRCNGPCRKTNEDKYGNLCCSEVITEGALPKKRRSRKRFKRREREDSFDSF